MTDKKEIVVVDAGHLVSPIGELNAQLEGYLVNVGLPVSDVVAPIAERKKVIEQLASALEILPHADRGKAHYLSRFTIAVAAGLFEAATGCESPHRLVDPPQTHAGDGRA